jgi:Rrf2 family transcriptional regulator, iron-sulfur cluster assembly transcription factor
MLSRACGYAVRACVFLARRPDDSFVPVREIGQSLDISSSFLSKIVGELSRNGIVDSCRGPSGGISLAQPAANVSVRDIIVAIDGGGLFTSCVLGLPGCGVEKPCPLHREWSRMRAEIEASFQAMTLQVLAEKSDSEIPDMLDARNGALRPQIDSFIVASTSRVIRFGKT